MTQELHVLILEDRIADAELMKLELRQEGIPFTARRVWTEADFRAALADPAVGLVLADYALPSFDGLSALRLTRQLRPDVPFILVSGSLGEDLAVQALHAGATDYLLKQRLARLGPAVRRALREAAARAQNREAEAALRRSEERYRTLVEAARDVIFTISPEGLITSLNSRFDSVTGWKREEWIGRHFEGLVFPEDLPRARELFVRAVQGESLPIFEVRVATASGHPVPIEFSVVTRFEAGRVLDLLGIARDVSEKKTLEAQFFRAQRLESVGQLAGGIAHDLNNILTPIVMLIPLLRESIHDPSTLALLDTIETSARRGAQIVKQILTFARGLKGERIPLQTRHLFKEISDLIRETFARSISLRLDVPNDLWLVEGDPTQLHQVLLNLCVNARDAMPEGGTLTLAAENVHVTPDLAAPRPHAKAGPHVCWLVADTGTGIPPNILDRIFDPFFTTKDHGQGTGLGLSTVLGIVQNHGGWVEVESQPGQGTRFRIFLPAVLDESHAPSSAALGPLPRGQGERILVVDDENSVRRLVQRVLEDYGYRVLVAGGGDEGLHLFEQHAPDIRAVLTDLDMPAPNGEAFIGALHRLKPEVRIIRMSGHARREESDLGVSADPVLSKPFTPEALLRTVHHVLAAT